MRGQLSYAQQRQAAASWARYLSVDPNDQAAQSGRAAGSPVLPNLRRTICDWSTGASSRAGPGHLSTVPIDQRLRDRGVRHCGTAVPSALVPSRAHRRRRRAPGRASAISSGTRKRRPCSSLRVGSSHESGSMRIPPMLPSASRRRSRSGVPWPEAKQSRHPDGLHGPGAALAGLSRLLLLHSTRSCKTIKVAAPTCTRGRSVNRGQPSMSPQDDGPRARSSVSCQSASSVLIDQALDEGREVGGSYPIGRPRTGEEDASRQAPGDHLPAHPFGGHADACRDLLS